jgi:hypothetical protein
LHACTHGSRITLRKLIQAESIRSDVNWKKKKKKKKKEVLNPNTISNNHNAVIYLI